MAFHRRGDARDARGGDDVTCEPVGEHAAGERSDLDSLVVVNVSPIDSGHVLLVPHASRRHAQVLDRETIDLALDFAASSADPTFRVAFNSMGGWATVNHLHLQAYYIDASLLTAAEVDTAFPVERESLKYVGSRPGGVRIYNTIDYPIWTLVYRVDAASGDRAALAAAVDSCVQVLIRNNIAHNLLFTPNQVFLFPRRRGRKGEHDLHPAGWELAGHMVVKDREQYEALDDEQIRAIIARETALKAERELIHAQCYNGNPLLLADDWDDEMA